MFNKLTKSMFTALAGVLAVILMLMVFSANAKANTECVNGDPPLCGGYLFAGQVYTGTIESTKAISSAYTMRWTTEGDLFYTRPISDPVSVSFAIMIAAGRNDIAGVGEECTMFLDEAKTDDPWDSTQVITMSWTSTIITVTPTADNHAWARILCSYNAQQPEETMQQIFLPLITRTDFKPYGLSGVSYNGMVNELENTEYRLTWDAYGSIAHAHPARPLSHTIAFTILPGSYTFKLSTACKVNIDEKREGDAFSSPDQSISMNPNGASFTVTTTDGGEAWAVLICMY